MLGDSVIDPTIAATAGAATTVTIGNHPIDAIAGNDDFLNNLFLHHIAGPAAGDDRTIKDYDGATTVITIGKPDHSATPTTASKLLVTRRFTGAQYLAAVKRTIRELAHVWNTPIVDASRFIGSLVGDGDFADWDSGDSVATGSFINGDDGWKVQGTSATAQREAAIVYSTLYGSRYSPKITSNSTNDAYLEWLLRDWARWAGVEMDLKGSVYGTAAVRNYLRVADGTQNIKTDTGGTSGEHTGTAGWEDLSKTGLTPATAATKLGVQAFIEGTAGGAITAYFNRVRLIPTTFVYDVLMPDSFTNLQSVWVESGAEGIYNLEVPAVDAEGNKIWEILSHDDGRPYLHFHPYRVALDTVPSFNTAVAGLITKDRRVMLRGTGYRTDTIAETTNIEINPQLVALGAAARLARTIPDLRETYNWLARDYEDLLSKQTRRRPHSSVRVRG